MAFLPWSGRQILTSAGVAAASGKLRIYTANTTTLASVYSDAGMSVALTNPVTADSLGFLPNIYLSDSSNYDIAEMTSGSVLIRTFDDVPALGSDSATLLKDFTNSRFQVRGSGGTIYVEAGDASPDNSGGVGRMGGWAGTQADSWTLDAATANATGWLKERSKKLPGIVQTEATSFSAASTVDIPLTENVDGVRAWEVVVFDLIQSAAANLQVRFSYDGASNYKSGASDYNDRKYGATGGASGGAAGSEIDLTVSSTTPTNTPGMLKIRIITPDSGSNMTLLWSEAAIYDNAGTPIPDIQLASGFGLGGYGRATHMRLLPSSGTITGKYRVTPLYGFGET